MSWEFSKDLVRADFYKLYGIDGRQGCKWSLSYFLILPPGRGESRRDGRVRRDGINLTLSRCGLRGGETMATGWRNDEDEASYSVNTPLCEVMDFTGF